MTGEASEHGKFWYVPTKFERVPGLTRFLFEVYRHRRNNWFGIRDSDWRSTRNIRTCWSADCVRCGRCRGNRCHGGNLRNDSPLADFQCDDRVRSNICGSRLGHCGWNCILVRIQSCPVLPLHAAHNYERYTYSITMAALIIKSASLLEYWSSKTSYHVVAILLFILVIFIINSRGVKVCTSVPCQS